MQSIKWLIGCSGFQYKEWKEVFYPAGLAQTTWFDYYCQHFNTLELNVTFYRFPKLASLQKWYQKSPDDFTFSAKVPQSITHYKRFKGTEDMMKDFYDLLINGLEHKLGAVLFQLPPNLQYSEEKLEAIISQINPSFTNVIEFRHNSWWTKEVMAALAQKNISFCGVSFPKLEDDAIVNTSNAYYRFHGVPKLYYSSYKKSFLKKVTEEIQKNPLVEKAYIYFNNTASAAALDNARYIQELVK